MSIFNRHKGNQDDPWEMMSRQHVYGYCEKCKHQSTATKSAFRNGVIEYRCHSCNKVVNFQEGADNFNNPYTHPPRRNGDDDGPAQTGSGRYVKGKR